MSNSKNEKIIRPNPARIIFIFISLFLIFEIIFILSFYSSLDEFLWIFTPILSGVTVVFCIAAIRSTFYRIEGAKIVHSKLGKESDFYFNDIVYINEEFSEKHKMILFYDKYGKDHYLLFDKNKIIYETMLNKVRQISEEEFKRRFPNVKL